jgi:hypothetical protein
VHRFCLIKRRTPRCGRNRFTSFAVFVVQWRFDASHVMVRSHGATTH